MNKQELIRRYNQSQINSNSYTEDKKQKRKKYKKQQQLEKLFVGIIRQTQSIPQKQQITNRFKQRYGNSTMCQIIKKCNLTHWVS